jgi:hypothetical protein
MPALLLVMPLPTLASTSASPSTPPGTATPAEGWAHGHARP